MSGMNRDQLDYLASLVRMDIRRRERGLAKFAPKDGQDPAEAEAVREEQAGKLTWKREVLDVLRGERRSDGVRVAMVSVPRSLLAHLLAISPYRVQGSPTARQLAALIGYDLAGSRKSAGMLADTKRDAGP